MGTKTTVAVGVVALVVGAGLGIVASSIRHRATDQLFENHISELKTSHGTKVAALETEIRSWKGEAQQARGESGVLDKKLKDAQAELTAANEKSQGLSEQLARAEARLVKLEGPGSRPESARAKPTFAFTEFGDALDKVDWGSVAEHTTAIVGPIREIADALLAGKPVPLKAAGETQKHNGPLIQAVGVIADKLSGTGPNGAYTHPAFQVNALAAALEKIGKPLSESQRATLEDIGRRFTEEERRRVASYDDTTFQMKKLVEEGELKNRFFNAVREALTTDQLDAISPAPIRDRVAADLWSEGLLWATVTRQVRFDRKEQVTDTVSRTLGSVFKLDEAQKAKVAGIAADWVSRLPQGLVERKSDALEAAGMAPSDLVAEAAVETRKLIERVATDLALGGDQLASARRWGVVFYPVPGDGE